MRCNQSVNFGDTSYSSFAIKQGHAEDEWVLHLRQTDDNHIFVPGQYCRREMGRTGAARGNMMSD